MTPNPAPSPKKHPLVSAVVIGLVIIVLFVAGGFGFASSLEEQDSFCASCHTQPEVTYFQRSTAARAVDLASYHPKISGCIGCHSGRGTAGRLQAELLGARNAFKWVTGTAVQPAVLTQAIRDQNCLECHKLLVQPGFSPQETIAMPWVGQEGLGKANHWHTDLARWQAASSSAGGCISCHPGHSPDSPSRNGFMNALTVQNTCAACHQVLKKE